MGKTVKRNVHVFNPETGESEVLTPGMKVPDYAKDQVTNPKVFEDPAELEAPVNDQPVPSVDPATQQGDDGTDDGGDDGSSDVDAGGDGELKGKALDAALKDAGLSTKGTADEKRARLAAAGA